MIRLTLPVLLVLVCLNLPAQNCGNGILDPRVAAVLHDSIKDLQPKLSRLSIEVRRKVNPGEDKSFPAGDVQITIIPGDSIPVYIFNANHGKNLPAVLYFHSGAFVFPFLPFMKQECWRMSKELNAIVFAVDYRTAPQHKFPAAVNDAYRSFEWLLSHGSAWDADINKLVISGISAGANLSAVVCQKAKKTGLANKIKLQVL
ncbi:MAG TPA: alpha/beta hydrolase fold domain-containing protein, partial [Chryseolinea sp.]|nr:alpha/beta hydrolase fold domain-containing protein [Chryseolinea sp.]